jgi:hypothetical protein
MKDDLTKVAGLLKRILTFLFFVCITVSSIWLFIYVLYRIAIYSTRLYTLFFSGCAAVTLAYFIIRGLRKNVLSSVVRTMIRVFLSFLYIVSIIAVFVVYGGFTVRYPVIGGVGAPFILFAALYFLPRLHFFNLVKRYFS